MFHSKQDAIEKMSHSQLMEKVQQHMMILQESLVSGQQELLQAEAQLEWIRLRNQELKHEQEVLSQGVREAEGKLEEKRVVQDVLIKRKNMLMDLHDFFQHQRFMGNGQTGRFYSQSLRDFCDARKKGEIEIMKQIDSSGAVGRVSLEKEQYAFLVVADGQVYFHPESLDESFFS